MMIRTDKRSQLSDYEALSGEVSSLREENAALEARLAALESAAAPAPKTPRAASKKT